MLAEGANLDPALGLDKAAAVAALADTRTLVFTHPLHHSVSLQ